MIYIGLSDKDKIPIIREYVKDNNIAQLIVISADEFPLDIDAHHIKFSDTIMYKVFYPLLQEINKQTLVVINECLRTQNRYDLNYNCIRQYLNLTDHQIVFQYLPLIDTR